MSESKSKTVKVVVSYAKKDYAIVKRIIKNSLDFKTFSFRSITYRISIWWDDDLEPSHGWKDQITKHFKEADVIIFMLSQNLLASKFILNTEIPLAMRRYNDSGITILGVVLESCNFESVLLRRIQLMPQKNAKLSSVKRWSPKKEVYRFIENGVKVAAIKSIANLPGPLHELPEGITRQDEQIFRSQFLSYKDRRLTKYVSNIDRESSNRISKKTIRIAVNKKTRGFFYRLAGLILLILISGIIYNITRC